MGGALSDSNDVIVTAFKHALRQQAVVAGVLALLAVAGWVLLTAGVGRARPVTAPDPIDRGGSADPPGPADRGEPAARRLLRIGFGLFWVLDGVLQAQQSMAVGLPTQVVGPAAAGSPAWVQDLVHRGLLIWTRQPIAAATATVWIQIGVGLLLLLAPRGRLSRGAGVVSAAWGLVVWVFGEAFGGIFAPGLTWMFGAPGAVVFYVVAGVVVALPPGAWEGRRVGRVLLSSLGGLFVALAVLQAWPGRGFWQGGTPTHGAGPVAAMARSMSSTPQPSWLSSWLRSFADLVAAHGGAFNLALVLVLASIGVALLSGRRRIVYAALALLTVVSLADWVLVQDFGFLGGVGTDPNSMLPIVLVALAGYVALTHPGEVSAPTPAPAPARFTVRRAPGVPARALLGAATASAALGVMLVGAVPMAAASVDRTTAAVVTEALNGQPQQLSTPAAGFALQDQFGRTVSLRSLRGRTVALTFLDPVCTSDCPLIAQQFASVDRQLDLPATTAFVAIVANPVYRAEPFVRAFDTQERLGGLSNWYFLTGSQADLGRAWSAYGIEVQTIDAGGMVAHDDSAFVIDRSGRLRAEFGSDPGGDVTTEASLATVLSGEMRAAMRP